VEGGRVISGIPVGGAENWVPLVQVVRLDVHPFRAADVDVAVLVGTTGGGCRLRVVSLVGSDLPRASRHLLDKDPVILTQGAAPVGSCRVGERTFDSADQAMAAACSEFPAADPNGWVGGDAFYSSVMDDPEFSEKLKPWAYHPGDVGVVVATLAGMAVFAAVLLVAFPLNIWLGLNTPERQGTLPDDLFAIVTLCLAGALSFLTFGVLMRLPDHAHDRSGEVGRHRR
jgi:hypothetical protein